MHGCQERAGPVGHQLSNVTLKRYEAAVPGYVEALLCDAGRDTNRGSLTVGRVVAAFALLDAASKRQVELQWESVARAQPESIPVIGGWLLETGYKMGGEWTTLVRSVVPHLLTHSSARDAAEGISV